MDNLIEEKTEIENLFDGYLDEQIFQNFNDINKTNSGIKSNKETIQKPELYQEWIVNLLSPSKKDEALAYLCRHRFEIPNLASILWNSFGIVTMFVYDISTAFSYIVSYNIQDLHCKRICNELALFHLMAINSETRPYLLKANFPIFLYPFVRSSLKTPNFEYIRLLCVIIISALVSFDDPETSAYVLSTELIPLCLSFFESDKLLCTLVAANTIENLLNDDVGLQYICNTYDRFSRIVISLGKVINQLSFKPNKILLKHVFRCYNRLSTNSMAVNALIEHIPTQIMDETFSEIIKDDEECKRIVLHLKELVKILEKSENKLNKDVENSQNPEH